jgi:hypothetical protein
MNNLIKAKDLQPGQVFKMPEKRKRKRYTVIKIIEFEPFDKIPEYDKGKLLILVQGCQQIVVLPEKEFELCP